MTNPASFKIDSPTPQLAAEQAEAYWDMMAASFEYGGMDYNAEDLAADCLSGDVLLIRVWNGDEVISVSAVRVREFFGTRDLQIMVTESRYDIKEWVFDFDKVLEQIAQEADCQTITVQTREGIGRLSKRAGYKVHQVIIRKELGTVQ